MSQKAKPHTMPHAPSAKAQINAMIRVNHAGEYGAKRIYEGQIAFIKDAETRREIEAMAKQEEAHLEYFEHAIIERQVRPTALQPLWHVGGYMLGAATALMGKHAAMACTVAVESVIDEHYAEQEQHLENQEQALKQKISQFRAEEMEHHETALIHGAEQATAYPLLTSSIRGVTKLAIALSKRI